MFNQLITMGIIALIVIIMTISLICSLYILRTVNMIKRDLKEGEEEGAFESIVLKNIIKRYRKAAEGNIKDINTQAIIEKEFNRHHKGVNTSERVIKNASSLMIIFGLFGTFFGLTIAVGKLIDTLQVSDFNNIGDVLDGLKNAIGGMKVAFTTSLFGIAGSIVAQITKVLINPNNLKEELMIGIEEYLDNVVAKDYVKEEKEDDIDLIEEKFEELFQKSSESIQIGFKKVMENSVAGLIEVARVMESNGRNLNDSIEKFDNTIDKFSRDSREFSEFNLHLRDNISRMNVVLGDFSENIKSKEISK